ncbi:uncharacterized protein GGS22DRAFT_35740 [Annulohypoxylon maeteangense]|uniref:uncharacterized protein n=1 Tax=Annulohypoxylon maeteangense TaxID=1927788 RepID=UPI002007271F|nr:uncharacterized protein GGS22DRAFT_35740 [Annulohypoxylon maeteangense]KAI0883091.1 hypothetical protein GGS22DRAFT_35740 [Annulohypoxylon maeteangense]
MAGILSSYSDSTCNTHNALQNISEYACGVTFQFKDSDNPPDMHYGVVSLQRCCDEANQPLLRIPGNTGCEMQFCELPAITTSYTSTIRHGGATETAPPTVTEGIESGWPSDVVSCMKFVYKGDLPDDIVDDISYADSWCVIRMYNDALDPSEVSTAVTASAAPASWTSAAVDPFESMFSSKTASSATAGSTSTSNGCGTYADQKMAGGIRIWVVLGLMFVGVVAAL